MVLPCICHREIVPSWCKSERAKCPISGLSWLPDYKVQLFRDWFYSFMLSSVTQQLYLS